MPVSPFLKKLIILLFVTAIEVGAVTVAWDPSTPPTSVDGYYLYLWNSFITNKIDAGTNTTYTFEPFTNAITFVGVTAYKNEEESGYSNLLTIIRFKNKINITDIKIILDK